MFVRTKTDVAKDKATKKAKSAGDAVAARSESVKGSVMSTAASAIHSVSDAVSPKAAAAAAAAKGNAENAKAAALERTAEARSAAADRTADVRSAAAERTAEARGVAKEKAASARDSAVSGLDRGIDAAVPAMQHGVEGVSDKVDSARDKLVDDLLPKLQELLGNAQAAKNDVLAQPGGAVAVVTGAPKKRAKKGGFLIAFGILAAIGAGVAYYLSQQKSTTEQDTDPWAGTADAGAGEPVAATAPKTTGTPAAAPFAASTEAPTAGATQVDEEDMEQVTAAPASTNNDNDAESDVEELPKMIEAEDVPGTDPDAQAGFGTDFSSTDDGDTEGSNSEGVASDGSGEGKHRA